MLTHIDHQHASSPTLDACLSAFLDDFAARIRIGDACESTLKKYRNNSKHITAELRARPVTAIRRADVRTWHRALAARTCPRDGHRLTSAADGALKVLACVYSFLIDQEELPGLDASPTSRVKRLHKAGKKRSLGDEELAEWRFALDIHEQFRTRRVVGLRMGHPRKVTTFSPTVALRLLDLTGARSSEIRTLRIEDLQLPRKQFTLRSTKTGEGNTRPLSTAAIAEIRRHLARMGNPSQGWLFPSTRKPGHPISDMCMERCFDRVMEVAGIPNATRHTLRHTLISRGFAAGFSATATSGVAGHSELMSFDDYRDVIPGESWDLVEAHAVTPRRAA